MLIVENLLMHKEIHKVFSLMKEFAELRNDNIVARYAAKALIFPYEIRQKFPGIWRLSGDPDFDSKLRDQFVYENVFYFILFCSFFLLFIFKFL